MTSQQFNADHCDVPMQREFVDKFVQSGTGARQILIAPPGTGKTTVAIRLMQRLMHDGQVTRGLVLCPASLVGQYEFGLSGDETQPPVHVVDRFRLREWEAAVPIGESPLPDSIVAIISIDLAKQSGVSATLAATRWDLLIVDEAHSLVGQRAQLARTLLSSETVKRVLIVTATPLTEAISNQLAITDWTPELQSAFKARAAKMPPHPTRVRYSDAETNVFSKITALADHFSHRGEPLRASVLRDRAFSSIYAFEQTLLRLRNETVHAGITAEEDPSETVGLGRQQRALNSDILPDIESVVSALEEIGCDSKIDELSRILTIHKDKSILIFSRFVDTVQYLGWTLTDRGYTVQSATLGSQTAELNAASKAVVGEITVLTLAVAHSCEFGSADMYVFYEQLKDDEKGLYAAPMLRTGRDRPPMVVFFEDPALPASAALADEPGV